MAVEDDIKELRSEFEGIDRAIIDGAKNMRNLQSTLSKTNAVLGSKNWEIFSRFISGTGLWRVQNRVKATVQLLNEMASSTERRRLEEVKQLKVYAEIANQSKEIQEIQANIEAAESSTGKAREAAIEKLKGQSVIFSGLLFQYQDSNKALKEMSHLMSRQTKDMEKLEKIATKTARRRKEGLIANSLTFKMVSGLEQKMKSVFGSTKGIANTKLSNIAEAATDAKEGFFGISEEEIAKRFEAMGRSESDKEFVKMAEDGKPGKIGKGKGSFASAEQIKEFNELVMLAEESRRTRKKMARKTAGFFKFAATPITNIAKQMVRLSKGILSIVRYMAMAAGYLLILMLGLTLLKSVFDETKDELAAGFATLKEVFAIGMAIVSEGLGQAKDALQRIWAGFQEGKIMEVVYGVGDLLIAGLKILGGLLVATLGAVLAGIGTYFVELYNRFYNEAFGKFDDARAAVVGAILKVVGIAAKIVAAVAFLAVFFGGGWIALLVAGIALVVMKAAEFLYQYSDQIADVLFGIKDFIMGIPDAIRELPAQIAEFIGDKFKEAMDVGGKVKDKVGGALSSARNFIGLAEGGKISQSGLAVVGERGPELVQLPRGAQVHSNSASKAIASSVTNHITVQVTGRVGASDTEIRDIANKVAREINSRMNRTSTSVVKF
tara:strand:+ start:390 stop:2381 length:1992 start_codon:yes stop_codon:yes gene_type:complete